jgi:hypothetical protein
MAAMVMSWLPDQRGRKHLVSHFGPQENLLIASTKKVEVYTARDKCLQERVLISLHVCFESDGLLFRCAPAQATARVGPWAKQDVDSVWGRRRTPVMLGLANLARHPARCVSQLAKPCPGADLHGRR